MLDVVWMVACYSFFIDLHSWRCQATPLPRKWVPVETQAFNDLTIFEYACNWTEPLWKGGLSGFTIQDDPEQFDILRNIFKYY